MTTRPVLLDLFCGAGGTAVGYHRAGFDVVGVDIAPQPRYPFTFHQADALTFPLDGYDAIHASPTCQTFARVTAWRGSRDDHPDLLAPTMARLAEVTVPWVVENVPEAPLRRDFLLCGSQFGLNVRRHRVFQTSPRLFSLIPPCRHRGLLAFEHKGERAYADALGCEWMTNREARQAIPPAFTQHIGEHLAAAVGLTRTHPTTA
jgi:DNA (cytosine-5)-methyltransferase 1